MPLLRLLQIHATQSIRNSALRLSKSGSLRSFSSISKYSGTNPLAVMTLEVPSDVSRVLYDEISESFDQIPQGQITLPHVLKCFEKVNGLIHKINPEFVKELADIKKTKPIVTFLRGIKTPEDFTVNDIPQGLVGIYDEDFIKKTGAGAMSVLVYNMMIGVQPLYDHPQHIVSYIFPTNEHKDSPRSSHSSQVNLGWHVDGWQFKGDASNIPQYSALHCIIGNQQAITEVVTAEQIISQLSKETIEELQQEYFMDYIDVQRPVIDKNGKISFSCGGCIVKTAQEFEYFIDSTKINTPAMLELYDCLKKLTPVFSEVLESGDLLNVKNRESLHRRVKPTQSPSQDEKEGFIGKRLLIRQQGKELED